MKHYPGTIRIILGLIIMWGAVGTMDADQEVGLDVLTGLIVAGLVLLYSGIMAKRVS